MIECQSLIWLAAWTWLSAEFKASRQTPEWFAVYDAWMHR